MRCSSLFFLFIIQFSLINNCFSYEAEESEEFEYSNTPEINNNEILADGVGEVFVNGDDIYTNGVTEVEGTAPIAGSVVFSGPVKASGTVTIAGKCTLDKLLARKPWSSFRTFPAASGSSPLQIGQPIQLTPHLSPPSPPEITAAVLPTPEFIPPASEILPKIEPDPIPTITLPPVVIPAIVIPAYVLPKVVIPPDLYELATGKGNLLITGNDLLVNGHTDVDGSVPALGEVTFSGNVSAKGSVTICATF